MATIMLLFMLDTLLLADHGVLERVLTDNQEGGSSHVVRLSRKVGSIQCFCVHYLHNNSTSVGYNVFTMPIRIPIIAYVADGDKTNDIQCDRCSVSWTQW